MCTCTHTYTSTHITIIIGRKKAINWRGETWKNGKGELGRGWRKKREEGMNIIIF